MIQMQSLQSLCIHKCYGSGIEPGKRSEGKCCLPEYRRYYEAIKTIVRLRKHLNYVSTPDGYIITYDGDPLKSVMRNEHQTSIAHYRRAVVGDSGLTSYIGFTCTIVDDKIDFMSFGVIRSKAESVMMSIYRDHMGEPTIVLTNVNEPSFYELTIKIGLKEVAYYNKLFSYGSFVVGSATYEDKIYNKNKRYIDIFNLPHRHHQIRYW